MCHMVKCVAQMIQPEQVFLHAEPVDMRWSMDRLSLLIQQIDGRSPCDGTAYGFTNRNYSRLKLLIWIYCPLFITQAGTIETVI